MMFENVDQVNQQLKIRNTFLQANTDKLANQKSNLFNTARLMQALKKRNQAYAQHFDVKKLQPVSDPIRHLSQRAAKQAKFSTIQQQKQTNKEQLARQWNSQLFYQQFTFANQQKYVDQHQQYLIHSMVSKSFQKNNKIDKSIKTNLLNKLKGYKDNQEYSPTKNLKTSKILKQKQTNKLKYLNYIRRKVIANDQRIMDVEQFQLMAGQISKLWRILSQQIKSYQYAVSQQKQNPELAIDYSSAALIEGQFKQSMSSFDNQKEISEFIRKKYLSGVNCKDYCEVNQDIIVWAVPFAYYRAGYWPNFTVSLNDRGRPGLSLRQEFIKFHNSITAFDPTPQYFPKDRLNDLFYNSLSSIVSGTSIANDSLFKIGEIDFIWMVLKTIKLYVKNNKTKQYELQQVKQGLLEYLLLHQDKFKEHPLLPYYQFLYLGDYEGLITYHDKARHFHGLTSDDYIHLLLTLVSKPQIMDAVTHNVVIKQLQKQFKSYLSSLVRDPNHKQFTIFYIMQIFPRHFGNVITQVFNTWHLFNQINHACIDGLRGWKFIKFRYQFNQIGQLFEDGIIKLLRSLLQIQRDQQVQQKIVHAAHQLFNNQQNYIDFVMICQCKHLLQIKNTYNQNKSIQNLQLQQHQKHSNIPLYTKLNKILTQIIQSNNKLQKQYSPVIKFLQNYCYLNDIIRNKITSDLQKFLKRQQYIKDLPMLYSNQNLNKQNYMNNIFNKLQKYEALQLFFIYLQNVVYCKQKIAYMKGIQGNLLDYKNGIVKNLQKIKSQNYYDIKPYGRYYNF